MNRLVRFPLSLPSSSSVFRRSTLTLLPQKQAITRSSFWLVPSRSLSTSSPSSTPSTNAPKPSADASASSDGQTKEQATLLRKYETPIQLYPNRTVGAQIFIPWDKLPWYHHLFRIFGFYSQKALRKRAAENTFHIIAAHTERKDFYELLNLEVNVHNYFALAVIHIWMLLVRLRREGYGGRRFGEDIFYQFWLNFENRLMERGDTNPILLSKNLKRYAHIYYGSVMAYDEALSEKKDSLLADAIWRNVFSGKDEFSVKKLEMMVHYIHRELAGLDQIKYELLERGFVQFNTLSSLPDPLFWKLKSDPHK